MAKLTVLGLEQNQIGDAGVSALASVCAKGALADLKKLYFDRDKISEAVKATVKEVCEKRGIGGSPEEL